MQWFAVVWLKLFAFGETYKFSIDLCQVRMPFFPFCIIFAVGQIATSTQAQDMAGQIRLDWLAGWLADWLTARQLDGRPKRTPKGTSASTNTQLLRQSLRGCQLPTATYSHPKNDAYNCEFELQLQHKQQQQQQQQWPWPWQWHELRWWSYPFILAFAYSDQRASSVIAAGRKRPTRRWHMTWKNEKEAPLAPSYAPRWRWLTHSVSNWNKWSNVWLWDKPE